MGTDNQIIKNKAGEVVDITQEGQLISLFLEKVPDPVTRSILFGMRVDRTETEDLIADVKHDLSEGAGLICVMRRIINLTFVIALCRWKQLGDDFSWGREEDKEYFLNSRFTKLFRSAIGKEDITLDLQIFALMELWVSLKKSEEIVRGRFANIFATSLSGNNIGLTLQDVRDAIKHASFKTDNSGKFDYAYCSRLCYKLICSFPYLRAVRITYPTVTDTNDSHDFSISYDLNLDESVVLYPNDFYDKIHFIVTSWQLCELANVPPLSNKKVKIKLYLMVETSTFNNRYQYSYRSFDGEDETRVEPSATLDQPDAAPPVEEVSEVRKFLAFNYKNIRELALIICDAIKEQPILKNEIFKACKEKDSKIIPSELTSADSPDIYWDNIITLMLVEMGPSDFLELILGGRRAFDDTIFSYIVKNIGWRCIGHEAAAEIKKSYEAEVKAITERCNRKKKSFAEQICALRVRKILEAMNFVKNENSGLNAFEESLSFKYENILVCVNTLKQYREKEVNVSRCDEDRNELINIYNNIFKFLQIFYAGMDGYAEKKLNPDAEEIYKDGETNGGEEQKTHKPIHMPYFEAFTEAAAKKKSEVENLSLSQNFERFCKLCDEYNSVSDNEHLSKEEKEKRLKKVRNLKYLITRNYICDTKKLRHFVDIKLKNGTSSTIFEMLENFSDVYYKDEQYLDWLEYFLDLFFFLIYNEDYYKHGLYKEARELEDKDCDPVYPYLVTYYRENVDRDNLKKCAYRVPVPTGAEDKDLNEQGFIINILTEENYMPQPYFCIPLKYGSSENWWINPFLIPRGFVRRMERFTAKDKENK